MDGWVDGRMDGQMVGWVYVEFVEIGFFFLLGGVEVRCDFQNFMADCTYRSFF